MHLIARFTAGAAVLLVALMACRAADESFDEKTGPKIGIKAPAFTLKDQSGKERTLDELRKQGKVALVFYRSAGW